MVAIVTYARNRIALTVVRSLAKRGIKVITSDNIHPAMSFFSRYSSGHFIHPSPMRYPEAFIKELADKAREYKAEVIIPVHEETYILSKYKEVLREHGITVPVKDYPTILKVHNKAESMAIARELGIPVPRTWTPQSVEEVAHIASETTYPVVIKLRKGRGSIGMQYAQNASRLLELYNNTITEFSLGRENYPLVQEYIPGIGVGISVLFNQGQLLAKFTHKRLKELPITGGTSVERVSICLPEAEEYAERIMSHLKWHGVAMVEFRIDQKTQKPYFLEINPRFWGSLNEAVCSGVDFPYLLYQVARNETVQPVTEYKLGVRTIWLYGYLRALPDYLRTPQRWAALKGLLSFLDRKVHFDDFSISDPLPTLIEPLFALRQLFTKGRLNFETEEEMVKNTPF